MSESSRNSLIYLNATGKLMHMLDIIATKYQDADMSLRHDMKNDGMKTCFNSCVVSIAAFAPIIVAGINKALLTGQKYSRQNQKTNTYTIAPNKALYFTETKKVLAVGVPKMLLAT